MSMRKAWKARMAGVATVGILAAAGEGTAQASAPDPPHKWTDKPSLIVRGSAVDESVDTAAWTEDIAGIDEAHWVFVTGWVTEMEGTTVVGTRFATYKYNAEGNGAKGPPVATAYFPPTNILLSQGDSYKAVGIAVDAQTGDMYVVGEAPKPDIHESRGYAVIRYDKDLDPMWQGRTWTDIARWYDNDGVIGDDIPESVLLDLTRAIGKVTDASPGVHVPVTGEAQYGSRTDVGTIHYLDGNGGHTRDFTTGFNVGGSTTFNYGLSVHIGREIEQNASVGLPYITGSTGGTSWQYLLFLKYIESGGSYALDWSRTATGGTGFNEGRDIVAGQVEQPTNGNVSVYPAGVLSTTGNGREGSTSRYRE